MSKRRDAYNLGRPFGYMHEELVLQIVEETLATRPLSALRMTDGLRNTVYSVTLADREIIIRIHEDPREFESTRHNLEVLADLGLTVPRVIASDFTSARYPFAFVILTKLSGRDLRHELARMTERQMTRLAEQITTAQAVVATLPQGTGFGYTGIGRRAPHHSWWDVLLDESAWDVSASAPSGSESALEDPTLANLKKRIYSQIMSFEPLLRSVSPICFLDDITVKNVLIADGELQGFIDFDCVCYGDPLFWLGLTAAGVVCDVGRQELFYVSELCRLRKLDEAQYRVFYLYASWIALGFVTISAPTQTIEWRSRMLSAIQDWVTALEIGKSPT